MTPERRIEIVALLGVLNDGLPEPSRQPLSRLGFVHRATELTTCGDCLANGFVSRDCETCAGRGYLERRRSKDPYDTGRSLSYGAPKHEAAKERDAEIARLEAQTAPPRSEADLQAGTRPESWETERRKLHDRYDLTALEDALESLRAMDEDAYHVLHAVHVYCWMPEQGTAAVLCERGLVALDALLPEGLRVPAAGSVPQELLVTGAERNRRIRKLERDGYATQWIARHVGLSIRQVNRIIAGESVPDESVPRAPARYRRPEPVVPGEAKPRNASPRTIFADDVRTRPIDGEWDAIPHRSTHPSPKEDAA